MDISWLKEHILEKKLDNYVLVNFRHKYLQQDETNLDEYQDPEWY